METAGLHKVTYTEKVVSWKVQGRKVAATDH